MAKNAGGEDQGLPITGRKSAYVMRNRKALISATNEVFAKLGAEATVEDIAKHAEISVTTIYSHFRTQSELFEFAAAEATSNYLTWVKQVVKSEDDLLLKFVTIPRMLFRQQQTHPLYAEIARKNFGSFLLSMKPASEDMASDAGKLMKSGALSMDNPQIRLETFLAAVFGIYQKTLFESDIKIKDADIALEIALGILCIPPVKAKKLAHSTLPTIKN